MKISQKSENREQECPRFHKFVRLGELSLGSQSVYDLRDLRLVVRGTVCVETGAPLRSGLVEHTEETWHFLEGGILVACATDSLKARADSGTDGTVHSGQLLGLTDAFFARLMIWHLYISG